MSQTNTQGQEPKMGERYERNKLHQFNNKYDHHHHQFLKMTLQFLVSLSLLSFLLSYSSHLSCYFHDFSFHFPTLVFPVFGQALDKKYMFLICNGIIAFLAKNSSFTRASPTGGAHLISDEFAKTNEDGMKPMWAIEAPLEHKEAPLEHEEASMESKAKSMEIGARIGSESPVMIRETEAEAEADADAETHEMNMSIEELNRKFDQFIRKMKEEIRIGAQRQLIAVQCES